MSLINAYIQIIRPRHWYKNFLIFVPLVASINLFQPDTLILSLLGFVVLCLASSGSYVINDVFDYKRDLLHPEKKHRPIPSGRISRNSALIFGVGLLVAKIPAATSKPTPKIQL